MTRKKSDDQSSWMWLVRCRSLSFEMNEDEHQHVLTIIIFFFLLFVFLLKQMPKQLQKIFIQTINARRGMADISSFVRLLGDVGRNESMDEWLKMRMWWFIYWVNWRRLTNVDLQRKERRATDLVRSSTKMIWMMKKRWSNEIGHLSNTSKKIIYWRKEKRQTNKLVSFSSEKKPQRWTSDFSAMFLRLLLLFWLFRLSLFFLLSLSALLSLFCCMFTPVLFSLSRLKQNHKAEKQFAILIIVFSSFSSSSSFLFNKRVTSREKSMRKNEFVTTLIQSAFGNGNKPMAVIQKKKKKKRWWRKKRNCIIQWLSKRFIDRSFRWRWW